MPAKTALPPDRIDELTTDLETARAALDSTVAALAGKQERRLALDADRQERRRDPDGYQQLVGEIEGLSRQRNGEAATLRNLTEELRLAKRRVERDQPEGDVTAAHKALADARERVQDLVAEQTATPNQISEALANSDPSTIARLSARRTDLVAIIAVARIDLASAEMVLYTAQADAMGPALNAADDEHRAARDALRAAEERMEAARQVTQQLGGRHRRLRASAQTAAREVERLRAEVL